MLDSEEIHPPTNSEVTSLPQKPHHDRARPLDQEGWEKVHALALRQLDRFMSCEAKVLKGKDIEAIHDMRVASRRLQQVIDLIYPKPRSQDVRRLRRQIRRCRSVLGEVRNCDVLLERVDETLGKKRVARREAWTAVQHYLLLRRSEAYSRALRKLGKINPAVLYVNLKAVLAQDGSHHHPNGHHHHTPASERPAFSKSLIYALNSVWSAFEEQLGQSHRDARPAAIHGARIATKRLRYLLEVFHEFKVAGTAEGLTWLRQLQQQLGDWHDLEVLEQDMVEMVARPEFLREHLGLAMEVAKLISANRKAKAALEVRYVQMSSDSVEFRRLKDWLTYVAASPSEALATVSAAG